MPRSAIRSFDARAVLRSIEEDRQQLSTLTQTRFWQKSNLYLKGPASLGTVPSQRPARTLHEKPNLLGPASCYGLTESSLIICMTRPSDCLKQKLNTAGRMLPHTSLKVVSRDDPSKNSYRGEKVELLISGCCVMEGYREDEKRTSEALIADSENSVEKTWLRSGDETMVEANLRITGRIKGVIIRRGESIYPVVSLADERYGETVSAFDVLKDGIVAGDNEGGSQALFGSLAGRDVPSGVDARTLGRQEVQKWDHKRLSKTMVPKYVFWVDGMPLIASGKIEKFKL
ncbi:unnamed protein product [Diplocarpon coronariae]